MIIPNLKEIHHLLHIKKHGDCFIENQNQREINRKVIKSYIQCALSNIVKAESEQIEQISFFIIFRLIRHSKCEKKFFPVIG